MTGKADAIEEARRRLLRLKEELKTADAAYMKLVADAFGDDGEKTLDEGLFLDAASLMTGVRLTGFEIDPIFDASKFSDGESEEVQRFWDEAERIENEVCPLVRFLIALAFKSRQADLAGQGGGEHFQFAAYLIELFFKSAVEERTAVLSRMSEAAAKERQGRILAAQAQLEALWPLGGQAS